MIAEYWLTSLGDNRGYSGTLGSYVTKNDSVDYQKFSFKYKINIWKVFQNSAIIITVKETQVFLSKIFMFYCIFI